MKPAAILAAVGLAGGLICTPAWADIKIGVTLPLTGYAASYGEEAKRGAELAAEQTNSAGGIKGEKIQLLVEDDAGAGKTGIAATQKLLGVDNVPVIIGGMMSAVALPASPLARANKTVYISTLSSHPDLTSPGGYIYRLTGSDALLGTIEAQFSIEVLKSKTAAGLFATTEYSATNSKIVRAAYEKAGGKWLMSEDFKQGATDYRTQIIKLKDANADTLFITATHKEAAQLFRQMVELNYSPRVMGTSFLNDPAIFDLAGDAANNVYFATSVAASTDQTRKISAEFDAAYKAKFGKDPGLPARYFYDATRLAIDAINAVGPDGAAIDKWMATVKDFPGVTSTISFNAVGDGVIPATIKKIENGKFVETGYTRNP
jgi:branched-chain amino acid transport system substrate-binding protein